MVVLLNTKKQEFWFLLERNINAFAIELTNKPIIYASAILLQTCGVGRQHCNAQKLFLFVALKRKINGILVENTSLLLFPCKDFYCTGENYERKSLKIMKGKAFVFKSILFRSVVCEEFHLRI